MQQDEQRQQTVVSSGGKVLVIGGYLITQRPLTGYVLSVDARLYASIAPLFSEPRCESDTTYTLQVESPQFGTLHRYTLSVAPTLSLKLVPSETGKDHNEFVEWTLFYCLAAIVGIKGNSSEVQSILSKGLHITILGDSGFYSTSEGSDSQPKKTGLGSSAALVTSLAGGLLHHFKVADMPRDSDNNRGAHQDLLHNLAQFCHYKAQGKIGSGFDVSAAVYGSQIYCRFDPNVLQSYSGVQSDWTADTESLPEFVAMLRSEGWNAIAEVSGLSEGLKLMLGDVAVGAKTPVMVSKVMAWRQKVLDTGNLEESAWGKLVKLNQSVLSKFKQVEEIYQRNSEQYHEKLENCGNSQPQEWGSDGLGDILRQLRSQFVLVRQQLKIMGEESGADIEPDSQTRLADDTMTLPGVLISGVPGAGGMDGLFAIVIGSEAQERVRAFWEANGVNPLLLQEDKRGVLSHDPAFFADKRKLIGK